VNPVPHTGHFSFMLPNLVTTVSGYLKTSPSRQHGHLACQMASCLVRFIFLAGSVPKNSQCHNCQIRSYKQVEDSATGTSINKTKTEICFIILNVIRPNHQIYNHSGDSYIEPNRKGNFGQRLMSLKITSQCS
jgi:hypothetical protein